LGWVMVYTVGLLHITPRHVEAQGVTHAARAILDPFREDSWRNVYAGKLELRLEATAAFYRDVLGFTWDFGDETYAVVWRDNSAIHFVRDNGNPSGVHLFQWVKDVDAYHREIVGRGAVVAMEPTDQPYGIRELGIRDVNDVAIVFGQDIDHG
jgi:predicted enzyme related to lactoylglutathione lyase